MNKLFFASLIILVLIPTVLAIDIGYIIKTGADANIINIINELGYSYDLIDESNILSTNFDDYNMIIVNNDNFWDLADHIPVNEKNSLFINYYHLSDWNWISGSARTIGSTDPLEAKKIREGMITEGLPEIFSVYTQARFSTGGYSLPMYYLKKEDYQPRAPKIRGEISIKFDDSDLVIASAIPGTRLKNNVYSNARGVFFGITESDFWTQDSKQLFKNSISWVLYGEDGDEDGYHYDVDCNDADPEVWQNLPGYLDADDDGYGTGNLLQVCSGNELPEGYSEINGDCNDNNSDANPEGIEIPYNSIDEDCSGEDLNDVDEDGIDYPQDCDDDNDLTWQLLSGYIDSDNDSYGFGSLLDICSGENLDEGYSVTSGDCDDNDEAINPGSIDVYKNCKNDAPIVQAILKITFSEGETAIIEVIAEDPEDDTLEYSINSLDFTQTDNIFEWQTGYDDYGDYDFTITVSDYEYDVEIEVEVEVDNTNRAPECSEIPGQEWNEDAEHSLDLSLYCSDPDSEVIKYYFHETSEDLHIKLDSIDKDTGLAEFSVEENWNGEDWIILKVSDGKAQTLTNEIVLRILPINDTPEFNGIIQDIQWNEDTTCEDCLGLADYFSDADIEYGDELTFEVSPSLNIDIQIDENGQVSFVPLPNYYTTLPDTVVFSATDSELQNVYSHEVYLVVVDMNEAPEFQAMNCETDIFEDTEYNCQLEASDFENDELTFTISNQNNLVCEIENNQLVYYTSSLNYNGAASCNIKVADGNGGEDIYNLEVNVLPVNDAPTITSYSPTQSSLRILEGQSQAFSIATTDIDGDILTITWKLNDVEVGTGNTYLFNQPIGSYNLKAIVSDGESEDSHEWIVFVGDISDFTCDEVGGFVLAEKQICPVNGELLETLDSNIVKCCSVAGEPAFSDIIKRCPLKNQGIAIDIKKPDENDEFKIGETIDVKINIENGFEEDLDFDIEVSFYDITEDEEIENYEDSVDIDKGKDEDIETEFLIDEDIEEGDEYAVFVKIEEEDGLYCNEEYMPISIEREDNDLRIEEFIMQPETAVCGDYVFASAKIKNLGADSQDAYLVIENFELNVLGKTEEFELEEYDEDDTITKQIQFKLPDEAQAGKYETKATVFFNGESSSAYADLTLEECEELEQETQETSPISLQGEQKEVKMNINDKSRAKEIALMISTLIALSVVSFLLYLISKKSY